MIMVNWMVSAPFVESKWYHQALMHSQGPAPTHPSGGAMGPALREDQDDSLWLGQGIDFCWSD